MFTAVIRLSEFVRCYRYSPLTSFSYELVVQLDGFILAVTGDGSMLRLSDGQPVAASDLKGDFQLGIRPEDIAVGNAAALPCAGGGRGGEMAETISPFFGGSTKCAPLTSGLEFEPFDSAGKRLSRVERPSAVGRTPYRAGWFSAAGTIHMA